MPGKFVNGLAFVEPANTTEFSFAFINTKGEILFKQVQSKPVNTASIPHFEDGYFRIFQGYNRNLKIIDNTGSDVASLGGVVRDMVNISQAVYLFKGYYPLRNGIQNFNYRNGSKSSVAFINLKSGKVVYTDYAYIGQFDPVSGLAIAMDGRGDRYIDLDGNIAIELEKSGEW